jgi:excisionase family DNA binding protein
MIVLKDGALPEGWLQREEALARLGVADATLERMARDGRVGSALASRPGKKGTRVFVTADVDRLKREKEMRAALRPPSAMKKTETGNEEGNGAGKASSTNLDLWGQGKGAALVSLKTGGWSYESLLELIRGVVSISSERVPLQEKLWLTWEEASALSGIPVPHVRRLSEAGKIYAEKFGRSWRVLKDSLQKYQGSPDLTERRKNWNETGKASAKQ